MHGIAQRGSEAQLSWWVIRQLTAPLWPWYVSDAVLLMRNSARRLANVDDNDSVYKTEVCKTCANFLSAMPQFPALRDPQEPQLLRSFATQKPKKLCYMWISRRRLQMLPFGLQSTFLKTANIQLAVDADIAQSAAARLALTITSDEVDSPCC